MIHVVTGIYVHILIDVTNLANVLRSQLSIHLIYALHEVATEATNVVKKYIQIWYVEWLSIHVKSVCVVLKEIALLMSVKTEWCGMDVEYCCNGSCVNIKNNVLGWKLFKESNIIL